MEATIIELLKLAGALYLVGVGFMCICIFVMMLILLTQYWIDQDKTEEDHEL